MDFYPARITQKLQQHKTIEMIIGIKWPIRGN